MKAGDIILSVNGKPLNTGDDLIDTVTATPDWRAVNLTVLHDGKHENLSVVVGDLVAALPRSSAASASRKPRPGNLPSRCSAWTSSR